MDDLIWKTNYAPNSSPLPEKASFQMVVLWQGCFFNVLAEAANA
jgi:hypothetical protein